MRVFSIILFLAVSSNVIAQDGKINQLDKAGLKQGYWILYGHMNPDKGYCDSCKVEEGMYVDDQYDGKWIKYHLDGKTQRLVVTYNNGVPDGPYEKINTDGVLLEMGIINGQKQLPIRGYYPCGKIQFSKSYDESGLEHGTMNYYFNTCDCTNKSLELLQKSEQKLNGVLVDVSYEFYRSGCQRAIIIYGAEGEILKKDYFRDTCTIDPNSPYQSCDKVLSVSNEPCDPQLDSTNFKGQVKIFNKDENLIMEGVFKDGKIWNGEKYLYNSEGVLESIEIWKKGELKKRKAI